MVTYNASSLRPLRESLTEVLERYVRIKMERGDFSGLINRLTYTKSLEKEEYIFIYDDESIEECFGTLGRFCKNPELSFTWLDTAIVGKKIREENRKRLESL